MFAPPFKNLRRNLLFGSAVRIRDAQNQHISVLHTVIQRQLNVFRKTGKILGIMIAGDFEPVPDV
jgi:hypothetical protein